MDYSQLRSARKSEGSVTTMVSAAAPSELQDRKVGPTGLKPQQQPNGGLGPHVSAFLNAVRRAHNSRRVYFAVGAVRSEEHTSELQTLMRISYAGFCLKKKILT